MVMTGLMDFEDLVHRIGRELAGRTDGPAPTIFDSRWWSGTLLDWCLKDDEFKVQLFRFVDALPALHDDHQVARILEEYFPDPKQLAGSLQWGLSLMTGSKLGASLGAKTLRAQVRRMAQTFIAGATIGGALPTLERLWREGRCWSVDLLGEATVSEAEADQYRDRCLAALAQLHEAARAWPNMPLLERDHLGPLPRANLSVKLSALCSQLDPIDPEGSYHGVASRLRPILDAAMSLPAGVTFDMEQAELKDLTLMIFTRLLREDRYRAYPYAGIALQAYLHESGADLDRLLSWARERGTPVMIRLVKGAYWDAETVRFRQRGWPVPVYERKVETDANYETLTRRMLENSDIIRPAFGTHNLRTLAHAEAAATALGVPPHAHEFEMIFGMAEPLQTATVAYGRRLRLYVPIGELLPGMAYLVRRLLENTSNESFLRHQYTETTPLDRLLARPMPPPRDMPPHGPSAVEAPTPSPSPFLNEPLTDFSRAAARDALQRSLADVRLRFGGRRRYPIPSGLTPQGPSLSVRNPAAPDEVLADLVCFAGDQIPAIVAAARKPAELWRTTPVEQRAAILTKTAAIMRSRRNELAAWEIFETGKPWREADADVAEAIDFLEYYAREMRRLGQVRRLGHLPGELNYQVVAPRGLAAVIAPWNFPLAIPTGMVSAALVTGNGVLFKPSERSLIVGTLLADMLRDAGLPDGVLHIVPGGPECGAALVNHPDIAVIAFTGSREVGLRLMHEAAQLAPGARVVKKVIAEMGGKNAIIVDDTADLDEAVTGVLTSFTGYQGQKCSACSRAVVLASIHDAFVQRLAQAIDSLQIGPPEDPANRVGPMIDARALAKVREYVSLGQKEGRLVIQKNVPQEGYFAGPALFIDIRPEHRLAREEIFGPVLAVMKAENFEEALQIANASDYALTGGLYSRSPARIAQACEAFDVGNLYINRPITGALVGRQPFGGHRLSGIGAKTGGSEYLQQFMITRVISENTLRRGFAPSG